MIKLSVPTGLTGLTTRTGEKIGISEQGYCRVVTTGDRDDLVARGCTVVQDDLDTITRYGTYGNHTGRTGFGDHEVGSAP